jgi:hypothetical protein
VSSFRLALAGVVSPTATHGTELATVYPALLRTAPHWPMNSLHGITKRFDATLTGFIRWRYSGIRQSITFLCPRGCNPCGPFCFLALRSPPALCPCAAFSLWLRISSTTSDEIGEILSFVHDCAANSQKRRTISLVPPSR